MNWHALTSKIEEMGACSLFCTLEKSEKEKEVIEIGLKEKLKKIGTCLWELPKEAKPGMKVPAWLFLSEKLLKEVEEGAIEQAANVAFLPGIYKHSIALPDMHFGYS